MDTHFVTLLIILRQSKSTSVGFIAVYARSVLLARRSCAHSLHVLFISCYFRPFQLFMRFPDTMFSRLRIQQAFPSVRVGMLTNAHSIWLNSLGNAWEVSGGIRLMHSSINSFLARSLANDAAIQRKKCIPPCTVICVWNVPRRRVNK